MSDAAARKDDETTGAQKAAAPSVTSAIAPDLEAVGRFIKEMIARGAIGELVVAVLALLGKMRDLNTELMRKLAQKSRKRPPSETMRRLQLELPLLLGPAANDASAGAAEGGASPAPPPALLPKKKRGAKNPRPHGRPKLPAHLPRVPAVIAVPAEQRVCPRCGRPLETISYKTAEKLDVEPLRYVVRECMRETCGCPCCHEHVVTAPRADEVLDRGILGDELLVQALVDHYDDAVPWERMERNARQEDVPLSANTLAASVGRVIDLFEPVVEHIKEACLASSFTAVDATSMPVLDASHPLGIRTGSLWLIDGDHRYSYFVYAPTAEAKHMDALFVGRLQRPAEMTRLCSAEMVHRARFG